MKRVLLVFVVASLLFGMGCGKDEEKKKKVALSGTDITNLMDKFRNDVGGQINNPYKFRTEAKEGDQSSPYGIMNADQARRLCDRLHAQDEILTFSLIKENFALLEDKDKTFLDYFIYLCNLHSKNEFAQENFNKSFKNEFEYPKWAKYYRDNAKAIAGVIPNRITMCVSEESLILGAYDVQKKLFPFKNGNDAARVVIKPNSQFINPRFDRHILYKYIVSIDEMVFTGLPLEENAAKQYAGTHTNTGPGRGVKVVCSVDIVQAPKITAETNRSGPNVAPLVFKGQIKRVTVLDKNDAVIGTLFERR